MGAGFDRPGSDARRRPPVRRASADSSRGRGELPGAGPSHDDLPARLKSWCENEAICSLPGSAIRRSFKAPSDQSGTLIAIFPVTAKTVLQSTLSMKDEKFVKLEADKKVLPKEGTPVKLIIEVAK